MLKETISTTKTTAVDTWNALNRIRKAEVINAKITDDINLIYVDFTMKDNHNDEDVIKVGTKIIEILRRNPQIDNTLQANAVWGWNIDDTNPDYYRLTF